MFSFCLSKTVFPVQLVRGQSLELRAAQSQNSALLCGKYVSPLPDPNLALVGATHEFKEEKLTNDQVFAELKERTVGFASLLWDSPNVEVQRVTSGVRVQSERGKNGRMPIIGRLPSDIHPNAWVFTGLSSRGLLYHALYGDILTDAILQNSEESMLKRCQDLLWWRK